MNARRPIMAARPALACIILAVAAACSDPASPSPDGPDGLQISAAKASKPGSACQSPDPCPTDVQPPEGNQGQTLNVVITGTDFGDPREVCEVTWLLNGKKSSAIQTNSSSCVSTTQIDANISVAPDAPVDQLFDVQVFVGVGRGRRGGIGSELFTVKVTGNPHITILSATFDQNTGDGDVTDGLIGDGDPYLMRLNGADNLDYDARFSPSRSADLLRFKNTGTAEVIEFPDVLFDLVTLYPDPTAGGGFSSVEVNDDPRPFGMRLEWEADRKRHLLRFGDDAGGCGRESVNDIPALEEDVVVTRIADDEWRVDVLKGAATGDGAIYCIGRRKGNPRWDQQQGKFNVPFGLALTEIPG